MQIKKIVIHNDEQRIMGILHIPRNNVNFPCVITCHGYFSTKDSKKYIEIANKLCAKGFTVLRFDFRGCGESEGRIEETTLSGRVSDLKAVVQFLKKHVLISERIGLVGSSLGGCVAIVYAAEYKEIEAVAVWSTPSHLSGLFDEERLKRDIAKYNILESVKKVTAPILIIHGDKDKLVSLYHSKDLYESANCPKMLNIIKGGNHRLTNTQNRKLAIQYSVEWFMKYLA